MRKWINMLILIAMTVWVSLAFLSDVSIWDKNQSVENVDARALATEPVEAETIPNVELNPTVESNPTADIKRVSLKNPALLTSLSPEIISEYSAFNPDFRGWLKINGTHIDMPLVQSVDNDHYLEYDYKNQFSFAGSLYYDYRNQTNFKDRHAVIYGHYMKDGTMFHDLHAFKDENFYKENNLIELYGLPQAHRYEIFSVQIVSADTYTLNLPKDDDALEGYVQDLLAHSLFKKEYEFPEELKLLTLVTCTYEFDNARLLIHAVRVD